MHITAAMKSKRGFTMVELIAALVLSTFVLISLVGVAAQMIRFEMQGASKSGNTSWTLVSVDQMAKEVQNASHISTNGDSFGGCINYSAVGGAGKLNPDPAEPIVAFYYCTHTDANNNTTLWHYTRRNVGCPLAAPTTCGDPTSQGVAPEAVAQNVKDVSFAIEPAVNSLHVKFQVGKDPDARSPVRTFMLVDTLMSMQKAYDNSGD